MRIARYWAQASGEAHPPSDRSFPFSLWRASEHSWAEADQAARDAVRRMAARVRAGDPFPRGYGYADRPLKEEITRELTDASGAVQALITRNSYGALVLNTAELMFIDVDVPRESLGAHFRRRLSAWLGRPLPPPRTQTHDQLIAWTQRRRDLSGRLYETAAGFRLLITSRGFSPTSAESTQLLEEAGADPLYVRLCNAQECYRARLSPKAHRCEAPTPPTSFPWESDAEEAEYRRWEKRYEQAAAPYATCRLRSTFGTQTATPEATYLAEIHDHFTRANTSLPLA